MFVADKIKRTHKVAAESILDQLKFYENVKGYLLGIKDGSDDPLTEYKKEDMPGCNSLLVAIQEATVFAAGREIQKVPKEPDFIKIVSADGPGYIVGTKHYLLFVCAGKEDSELEEKIREIAKSLRSNGL